MLPAILEGELPIISFLAFDFEKLFSVFGVFFIFSFSSPLGTQKLISIFSRRLFCYIIIASHTDSTPTSPHTHDLTHKAPRKIVKVRFSFPSTTTTSSQHKKRTIPHHHVTPQWIENFAEDELFSGGKRNEKESAARGREGGERGIKSLKFYCEVYCYLTKESFNLRLWASGRGCVWKRSNYVDYDSTTLLLLTSLPASSAPAVRQWKIYKLHINWKELTAKAVRRK